MHTSKHLVQADFQPAIRPLFAQIIALTLSVIVHVKVFRFTDLLYIMHNKNATTQSAQFQAFCAVGRVCAVLCYAAHVRKAGRSTGTDARGSCALWVRAVQVAKWSFCFTTVRITPFC